MTKPGDDAREASTGDRLWTPIDVAAIGLPAAVAAGFVAVGIARDPLVAVAAVLMLTSYLFGYVIVGGVSRFLGIGGGTALVGGVVAIAGAVEFRVGRDASSFVYLVSPGSGLLASWLAVVFNRQKK